MFRQQSIECQKNSQPQNISQQYLHSSNVATRMIQSMINASMQNIIQKERMDKVVKECGTYIINTAHQSSLQCYIKKPDILNLTTMREDDYKLAQTQYRKWRVPIVKKPKTLRQSLRQKTSIISKSLNRSSWFGRSTEIISKLNQQKVSFCSNNFYQNKQADKQSNQTKRTSTVKFNHNQFDQKQKNARDSKFRHTQRFFTKSKQRVMRKTVTYLKQMIPQHFVPLYQEQQDQILLALLKQEFHKSPQFKKKHKKNKCSKQFDYNQTIYQSRQSLEDFLQSQQDLQEKIIDFGIQKFTGKKTVRNINKSKTNMSIVFKDKSFNQIKHQQFKIPKKIFLGNYVKKFNKKTHQQNNSYFDIKDIQFNETLRNPKDEYAKAGLKKTSESNFINRLKYVNRRNQNKLQRQQQIQHIIPKLSNKESSIFQQFQGKQNKNFLIPKNKSIVINCARNEIVQYQNKQGCKNIYRSYQ